MGAKKSGPMARKTRAAARKKAPRKSHGPDQTKLARLGKDLRDALAQQAATAKILEVMSGSPTDVQPVFDAIAGSAARLCEASDAVILTREGDVLRWAAHHGTIPGRDVGGALPVTRGLAAGRAVLEARQVHIRNLRRAKREFPESSALAQEFGHLTIVATPLLREGVAIGVITIRGNKAGQFGNRHLALLKIFADQAVIAIENVRLFNETKEALERQTATSEILKVISSSPTDTRPVFDVIARCGVRLFDGLNVAILLRQESQFVLAGYSGPGMEDLPAQVRTAPLDREKNFPSRAILDGRVLHITDWDGEEVPEHEKVVAKAFGIKSGLMVPLLRKGEGIGAITVVRATAGPFCDKDIALLQAFADQAVIAIENVRLFNETREALERQTATAEILKVISESPTDVQPVFDAIVESCTRLLACNHATLRLVKGDRAEFAASSSTQGGKTVVESPMSIHDDSLPVSHAVLRREVVQIPDTSANGVSVQMKQRGEQRGFRSLMVAPLLRDNDVIGTINVHRATPGRFTEKEVALLETFASQAVIAIENVRLLNETREALEHQKASADILRVISGSPTDLTPVMAALAESAARLCEATDAHIWQREGDNLQLVASHGPLPIKRPRLRIGRDSVAGRAAFDCKLVHVHDLAAVFKDEFPNSSAMMEGGYRSVLAVPLVREGSAIGAILIRRAEVRPFAPPQLALLQTFADQAVIAIENVRLFNETKEALERQTATAEILRVISRSPTDVQPVFDAIVQSGLKLFPTAAVAVALPEGDQVRAAAIATQDPALAAAWKARFPNPLSREFMHGAAILDRRLIDVPDAEAAVNGPYGPGVKNFLASGNRAITIMPMIRGDSAIGAISVIRLAPGPLTDNQIALLQTFADQAVIAIENVRLFHETKEALERQTATAEILEVMSGSPTDVQPVFDVIVESAVRLCGARFGRVYRYDGSVIQMVAGHGLSTNGLAQLQRVFPRPAADDTIVGRVILTRRPFYVRDIEREETVPALSRQMIEALRTRSQVTIPMLREGESIGAITMGWDEPEAFDEEQIALLKTFADQAVIAIENVRLFRELEARTEALTRSVGQLTALGEVGQAISSTLDLETVLKTIVSRAVQLAGLDGGVIYEYDEPTERFELRASENFDEESVLGLRSAGLRKGEGAVGAAVATREPVQVPDTHAPDYPVRLRGLLDRSGFRALLAVPLVREDQIIGALLVLRKAAGPFAPEAVELLKTFATQSALAIQNARLFREIAEKSRQLELASRHKSDFLASMSHELRTPLNAILGFNEMILAEVYGEVPQDMQVPLADIQSSGKHLLRLINNVLDLAKIEAGRMELALADYAVQDTVESVRSTLRPLAAEKGLEFLASVPADIPLAYGDSGRITQCLMNLAGNSLKFTKAGRVEISVEQKDGLLTYCVSDTGIGIPPDKIGSLFTEFKQTDATIANEYGGTGLGLSISRKFVEMHGGRIWVESETGKGSKFIFELPLRVKGQAAEGAAA